MRNEIDASRAAIAKRMSAASSQLQQVADKIEMGTPTPDQMDALLREYAESVNKTDLSSSSKSMYIDFANCFVRWTRGEFQPGKVGPWKRPKYGKELKP
jgi:hypothetical protein